jgi:hypothetical protein
MRRTAERIRQARAAVSRKACAAFLTLVACAPEPQAREAPEAGPVACSEGDPEVQRRGARCLCCHADDFSVAGSVDLTRPPARVVVVDAHGEERTMAPNVFGNFFAHFALAPPYRAMAYGADGSVLAMSAPAPHADCNACHVVAGPALPIHGP